MALSNNDALAAARNIWAGPRIHEAPRLNFIANALNPRRAYPDAMQAPLYTAPGCPTVEMPKDAPQVMKNLAWKSRTNFLPLVVDAFSQVIKADGYLESNGQPSDAWKYWQANGLDARQAGIIRSAITYGASYASVLPGIKDGVKMPVIHGYSPRRMTAIYQDPTIDDWPMLALDVNGPQMRLFDEEMVYKIGIEQYPISGLGAAMTFVPQVGHFTFLEATPHGFNFCPVARFRDRMLLDGDEQFGIVEPLIDIQRRVDETTFGMLSAQYYAAFKARYITGWIPKTEQEQLKASVADFWAFADPDVKVGELSETDITRYIESKNSALSDMASIAQIPASRFGAGGAMRNVGPEAVTSIDAGGDRKSSEIKTSLGETFELLLRAAAASAGDTAAAEDTSSQIRWRDMTTTSPGAVADALGKLALQLDVPREMLWKRIPGWTDQDQAQAEQLIRSGDSIDKLIADLDRQAKGASLPGIPGQQPAGMPGGAPDGTGLA